MKVIAEIGLTHEGSLGNAIAMIDAAADAGACGVKLQCHDGDPVDKFRPGTNFPQDKTRQAYWERTAFTLSQWSVLRKRAYNRGLQFIVSAFSHKAIGTAKAIEADAIKLGSGAALDESLRAACSDGWLILSTGLANELEVFDIGNKTPAKRLTVLKCCSLYPCPPEKVGLFNPLVIRPGVGVGLSDHSGTIWPGVVAAAMRYEMLEVHVCYSRDQFGPDIPASITFRELKKLVQGVRFVERMRNPTDKDKVAKELQATRDIFAPCASAAS